jgi:Ca2+-binding RTX toxin-like protein
MAVFQAFNTAGIGFNMATTDSLGWTFLTANPDIASDLVYDDGALAIFDIYGSDLIDRYSAAYSTDGDDIVIHDLLYEDAGAAVLSITGLDLYATVEDLDADAWFVSLNGGNDTFYGNDFDDIVRGGFGSDVVYTYDGDDIVYGDAGSDTLYGVAGDDDLYGGSGRDLLSGGSGSDYLSGGADLDNLTGGSGKDYFVFDTRPSASSADRITDFKVLDDTIMLDNRVFTKVGRDGWLSAAAFTTGPAAKDASDRVIYNSKSGALLYDPDGIGAAPAVKFAQLKAGLALSKADFYIL